jgi:serine/threonine protein kinase
MAVAIKQSHDAEEDDDMLEKEGSQLVRVIRSEYVIQPRFMMELSGIYSLATELFPNAQTIDEHLPGKAHRKAILVQILKGLSAIHGSHVVHGDFGPHNVMVNS